MAYFVNEIYYFPLENYDTIIFRGRKVLDRKTKFRRMRRRKRNRHLFIGLLTLLFSCLLILLVQWQGYESIKSSKHHIDTPIPALKENSKKNSSIQTSSKEEEVENKHSAPIEEPPKDDTEIHIIFAGDTMFDWDLRPILAANGYDFPFVHVSKKVQKADYAFVNAETVLQINLQKILTNYFG